MRANPSRKQHIKYGLLICVLLLGLIWLFIGPIPIEGTLFSYPFDFIGYWSAAHLLAHAQNFNDSDLLLTTQQTVVGWNGGLVVRTWNPPWLLPLLFPYIIFPFTRAAWLWLITNIFMIFVSAILAWQAMAKTKSGRNRAWVAPVIAIIFAPTLTALYMGQVNTFVLLGLALTLFFQHKNRDGLAGMGLALAMVKPHLVYITVPIILLNSLANKQWRLIIGFLGSLLLLTGITFVQRPTFIFEYLSGVNEGNLFDWLTPTLGDFINVTLGWPHADLMGIILLPLMCLWWWLNRKKIHFSELLQITLIVSVITAPFGWGYDAIVLLIPILQIVIWAFETIQSKWIQISLIIGLILLDGFAFYHRTVMQNEVEVFWIPIAIGVLYFIARYFAYNQQTKPDIDPCLHHT